MKMFLNKKIAEDQKENMGVLLLLIIVGFFQIVRCIDYPGLYMDAAMPDYVAVQLLFPQTNNPGIVVPHVGFPLLGQLYHGTVTVWLQLLVIGLTGKASMTTLRSVNMVYVIGICWFFYLICKRIGIKKIISLTGILTILLTPQVFSVVRTQYYIKLPGTLFLLMSIYCLLYTEERWKKKGCSVVVSGILCGLAFYSYFIFLFYVPGMIILTGLQVRKHEEKIMPNILNWLLGFCTGSVFYIVGYFDLLITSSSIGYDEKKVIVYLFGIIIILGCVLLCYYVIKNYNNIEKIKKMHTFIFVLAMIAIIILFINMKYILSIIAPTLSSLNVAGSNMNFVERIKTLIVFWQGVMDNKYMEWLMVDRVTSVLSDLYIFSFVVLTLITAIIYLRIKCRDKIIDTILVFDLMLLCYFVCSLPFASRMGGQHLTPVFFLTIMIQILELGYIFKNGYTNGKKICVCIIALLLSVSIINSSLLDTNVKLSGGKGKFTAQINQIAKEALDNKVLGTKEVYVFPEWGWCCGFSYLTLNQVHYMLSLDPNRLNEYLKEGYTFKVCGWDEANLPTYQDILEGMGVSNINIEYRYSNDGDRVFYILYPEN